RRARLNPPRCPPGGAMSGPSHSPTASTALPCSRRCRSTSSRTSRSRSSGPRGAGRAWLGRPRWPRGPLDAPSGGRILIGGVDIRHSDSDELRRATSLVFQESFLFATTVAENISLDSCASRDEIERAAAIAQADRFIGALPHAYDTALGERGHPLSGGERQRVALARALVRHPRVLIL